VAIFWIFNISLAACAMVVENLVMLAFQAMRLRLNKSKPREEATFSHLSRIKKFSFGLLS
jgi:hypothetical protein